MAPRGLGADALFGAWADPLFLRGPVLRDGGEFYLGFTCEWPL